VLDVQKKREEIKKLVANQRGKSQQIENLENEHKVRRRKLEARLEHQSEKICALEAQLSNRITLHQQVFPPLLIFSCEFLAEDTITECGKFSFSNY
jgi:hypothetical protein